MADCLSLDHFLDQLSSEVGGMDGGRLDSLDEHLVRDLKFDSFQMLLVVEFVSGLVDYELHPSPPELEEMAQSLRSLYGYYLKAANSPQDESRTAQPLVATTVGSVVRLRPVEPNDFPSLYAMAVADSTAWRWRYAGALPSYEEWLRTFSSGVLSQLVVVDDRRKVLGLVVAYNADLSNGFVWIAAMLAQTESGLGRGADAVKLFLRYLFWTWDIQKVYCEVPEYNLPQFESAVGRVFVEEGRLSRHLYHGLRRWDQVILAVHRDSFVEGWM